MIYSGEVTGRDFPKISFDRVVAGYIFSSERKIIIISWYPSLGGWDLREPTLVGSGSPHHGKENSQKWKETLNG